MERPSTKPIGLILAGGRSQRLFPESRPKPLLEVNGVSLMEQSLERLKNFETYVITNQEIGLELKKYLRAKRKETKFLFEPEGRDTAAAVGFGLRHFRDQDSWVAILSADQWLQDSSAYWDFLKVVEKEIELYPEALFVAASPSEHKPQASHSQFGWIVSERESPSQSFRVKNFIEKPQGKELEEVRKQGGGINGGMFFGKIKTFIKAYKSLFPQPLDSNQDYFKIQRTPVDRAIFEKYQEVRSIPLHIKWEDLGTWQDWAKQIGNEGITQIDAQNNFVYSTTNQKTYIFGTNDLAVIQTNDKTLVMPLSETRKMKDYLEKLKE